MVKGSKVTIYYAEDAGKKVSTSSKCYSGSTDIPLQPRVRMFSVRDNGPLRVSSLDRPGTTLRRFGINREREPPNSPCQPFSEARTAKETNPASPPSILFITGVPSHGPQNSTLP
jgi:hypothetical protein